MFTLPLKRLGAQCSYEAETAIFLIAHHHSTINKKSTPKRSHGHSGMPVFSGASGVGEANGAICKGRPSWDSSALLRFAATRRS